MRSLDKPLDIKAEFRLLKDGTACFRDYLEVKVELMISLMRQEIIRDRLCQDIMVWSSKHKWKFSFHQ